MGDLVQYLGRFGRREIRKDMAYCRARGLSVVRKREVDVKSSREISEVR